MGKISSTIIHSWKPEEAIPTVMISRPVLFVILCFGFFILIQSLVPKAMAMKKFNANEYTLEDQRTRKRKNYVLRLPRDSERLGNPGNLVTSYETDTFQTDPSNSEELSAFIDDYENRRNDVILYLLDNSVETRTRKRGNIKVEKDNQALPDPPCTCKYSRDSKDFGENSYPRFVETRNCSKVRQQACLPPYVCKENWYNLTIIRRRDSLKEDSLELPNDLKYKWIAEKHTVSVGCVCSRDYYIEN